MGLEVQSPMTRQLAPWTTRSAWLMLRGSFRDACDPSQMKYRFTERSSWECLHLLMTHAPCSNLTLQRFSPRFETCQSSVLLANSGPQLLSVRVIGFVFFFIKRLKGAISILCSLCFLSFLSSLPCSGSFSSKYWIGGTLDTWFLSNECVPDIFCQWLRTDIQSS